MSTTVRSNASAQTPAAAISARAMAVAAPWIIAAVGVLLAWLIVREGLAGQLEDGQPNYALLVQPGDVAGLNAAAESLVVSQPASAARLAERSLRARPLNPVAFQVLGQLRAAQGDAAGASRLFDASARWSKRDGVTDAWLLGASARRGDYAGMLEHADRLMRIAPTTASALYPTLTAMAGNPAARTALIQRLALAPPWRTAFLESLARGGPHAMAAVDVMTGLADAGAPPSAEEISPLLTRLVDAREYLEAFLAWRQFAPQTAPALASVRDGDFQGLQTGGPFVWALTPSAGADVEIAQTPTPQSARGQSLHVDYDGYSPASSLAGQLLVLAPGDYVFSAKALANTASPDSRLTWTLACADTGQRLFATNPASPLEAGWNDIGARLTVPATGCQGQWLRLWTTPGDRPSEVEVWFAHIVMSRVGAMQPSLAKISPGP